MEILISLWLVLIWKPLCDFIGKSTAWLYAKRIWGFLGIFGIFSLIAVSVWCILKNGPTAYIEDIKLMFTKSEAQRREERAERFTKKEQAAREKARKANEERHAKENRTNETKHSG